MKKFAVLLMAALMLVSFASISAQEKEMKKAHDCKSGMLDPETKVKFEKLKLQFKLDTVDIKAEQQELHRTLMEELMKDEVSVKTVEKIGKALDANHSKMMKAKMDYLLAVKKVLPADHFKAFLENHDKGVAGGKACGQAGCSKSAGHKCGPSCSSKSAGCAMAGVKGHTCTDACKKAEAKTGCEVPCTREKK